ncbi:MAG: amylo-alpha-1,6-glucosidase, partial [bacterium]
MGGPYAGIESHNSSPLLNRISFFYPVANSIDLSDDYWRRGESRIMFLGIKAGNEPGELLDSPFSYEQTPYMVSFNRSDGTKTISIAYEFCKNKPAMVATFEITNNSTREELFEFYTHLETSVKTSHTSALKSNARVESDSGGKAVYFNFADAETGNAGIFLANAGQTPSDFFTGGDAADSWIYRWKGKSKILPRAASKRPAAFFVYKKKLASGGKMKVVQIIGSAKAGEAKSIAGYLIDNHGKETSLYERYVLDKAFSGPMKTGDDSLDASAVWAKAIMAANAHYLDGNIVPMPCPAEYNFFFTHDALMTDLAAVNFDPVRVKNDLEFIAGHAGPGGIIPHAYYWKDNRYAAEFAGKDNWNHFWFTIVSAKYLRHSKDIKTLRRLYPFISTSIRQAAYNLKDDGLIWAYRPDWWDIGSSFGPRAYMTTLAIRAWREFIFISSVLGENTADLRRYADQAERMQKGLNEKLWDEDAGYLINYYGDGKKDPHLYIGSLLCAHFGLLDGTRTNKLVETAGAKILDGKVGVYNAFPMDFHLLRDYLKFSGDEAGGPYLYLNGGIWPHGNAWYALALIAAGRKEAALSFIKTVMTLDGIMKGPNGQPAMYEYRIGDKKNPSMYGKIDKPQFLWAGA